MSRIYFADELAIDRTISEHRGALERIRPEEKKGVEFSITGLGVKFEQQDKYIPLTLPEKIEILKSLLKADGELEPQRPSTRTDSKPYVLERCRAVRVVVPEIMVDDSKVTPALSFWLSPRSENIGQLCLLEGSGSDSENPFNYAHASSYTILQSLVYFARKQRRIGILDLHILNLPHTNQGLAVDDRHPQSLVEQYHNVKPFHYDFFTDPEALLDKWGCEISTGMEIFALYRVREYGPEAASNWDVISTFGYALSVEGAD